MGKIVTKTEIRRVQEHATQEILSFLAEHPVLTARTGSRTGAGPKTPAK